MQQCQIWMQIPSTRETDRPPDRGTLATGMYVQVVKRQQQLSFFCYLFCHAIRIVEVMDGVNCNSHFGPQGNLENGVKQYRL